MREQDIHTFRNIQYRYSQGGPHLGWDGAHTIQLSNTFGTAAVVVGVEGGLRATMKKTKDEMGRLCNNKLPTRDPLKGAPFIVRPKSLSLAGIRGRAQWSFFGTFARHLCSIQWSGSMCVVLRGWVESWNSIAKQLRGDQIQRNLALQVFKDSIGWT